MEISMPFEVYTLACPNIELTPRLTIQLDLDGQQLNHVLMWQTFFSNFAKETEFISWMDSALEREALGLVLSPGVAFSIIECMLECLEQKLFDTELGEDGENSELRVTTLGNGIGYAHLGKCCIKDVSLQAGHGWADLVDELKIFWETGQLPIIDYIFNVYLQQRTTNQKQNGDNFLSWPEVNKWVEGY